MSDQAVRIFEALSEVDEELLERCNRKAVRKDKAANRLFQRYGRAVAAGICLVVAGAVSWGGYQLTKGSYGSDSSGSNAQMELADMAQSMAVADGGVNGGTDTAGPEGNMVGGAAPGAGAAESGLEAPEAATTASNQEAPEASAANNMKITEGAEAEEGMDGARTETASLSGTPQGESMADKQQTMQNPQEQPAADQIDRLKESELALLDSREEIPWEEACATAPFSGYLPTALPAGYVSFCARRSVSPASWDNMIFKWTDGEHILSLNMTQGEAVTREEIQQRDGLFEYLAEDFRKEQIPELRPAEEPLEFTLYYADGMSIHFTGHITRDEMWEVVESVSK